MDTNYPLALRKVLVYEGGYVNHPKDPGGRTLQGVTQAVYDTYRRKHNKPRRLLTAGMQSTPEWKEEMAYIYRTGYWLPVKGPVINHGIDCALFDYAVNSGPGRAVRVLQKLVGRPVTGKLTDMDVVAANKRSPAQLVDAICNERLAFVKSLRTWNTFGKGWSARIASVRKYCGDLARGKQPIEAITPEAVATGKAQVPSNAATKGAVIATGGGAGGGAGITFGDWLAANPTIIVAGIVILVVGVTVLFYKLDEWRDRKQDTPMDVPVVPEMGS